MSSGSSSGRFQQAGRLPGGLLSVSLPVRLAVAGLLSAIVWLAIVWALA